VQAEEPPTDTDEEEDLSLEDHLPAAFRCPISHCIMEQPVVVPSGHSYDREALTAWLAHRPVDPLSGAPLSPASLYPNRALREQAIEELERLCATATEQRKSALSRAASEKLQALRTASAASALASCGDAPDACRLDRLAGRCASCATWFIEFAREQLMVFLTSFGAIMCLYLDVRSAKLRRPLGHEQGPPPPPGTLLKFFFGTLHPLVPMPKHWGAMARIALAALRTVILGPLVPGSALLSLGCILSVARFWQRFFEARNVELERAAQTRWWAMARDCGSALTCLASLGLFLQLHTDSNMASLQAERRLHGRRCM